MGKVLNGVVVDDELFREYHKFQQGRDFDNMMIKRLLHFFKNEIVTNIKQYEDNGVDLPLNLKSRLAHSGLKRQSLEDLAENCTLYKIILSATKNSFPYVNIMDDNQRLENNYSASFDMSEPRDLAIKHLTSLCCHAKKVVVYDKYFSNKERNVELLKQIFPKKKLEVVYNLIEDAHIVLLKQHCNLWEFTKNPQITNRHDRYLIIDDRLEVILTSGFDHLNETSGDLTYIVRNIQQGRF
ncbi:hypothetical protein [Phocaeicola vulgatus]|uniref:hypothetical protein n=1 Tax=Phocaeicola vulgatus TaxID=821 RepID=UPI001E521923|nr:hypothetical protein [Phocaeicola vulgatus]BDC06913.1 hypothetical protein GAIMETA21S03_27960 [Phocaeicola vulgatus]BDC11047.1 hypothetical protein GAIMETA21S07_28350 [Phocaeicola vulgatus]BDC15216.1 hypothetical protein GAIMETA21S10_29800 [Phocaeicola vulgatus]